MEKAIIQLITAFIGSFGFAVLFKVHRRHLLAASLGGFFSWGIYLFGLSNHLSIFLSSLFASAFSAMYAEILARWKKAPAILFFIPSVIPLVPGSNLYYAISGLANNDLDFAVLNAKLLLYYAMSIALGISIVWAVQSIERSVRKARCGCGNR